ncbi:MAG: antibiotic biosynthesis monooxygenase [Exiguobacterium sp.]|uniref:putative quinol monooxygenase n=1 Tax=Exiguobacterium profundum TaxID=307643 RepID=UPI00339A6EA8|nr:antibiotic biosynthesis monooxygenase [Exiguobacterium sp.]MBR3063935.1 antibiotic biosynthesis monooxygenase [Exiguobacterium sp.]MBR3217930.1 antibiotic biosynthesis monooxygenase [Exiguobacterium sp.]
MYALIGKLVTKAGERDRLVAILSEAAREMEATSDCESYRVHVSLDEAETVFVYEIWRNEEAHAASLSLVEVRAYIDQAKPILERMERIAALELRT